MKQSQWLGLLRVARNDCTCFCTFTYLLLPVHSSYIGLTHELRNNEPQRRRGHGGIRVCEVFCVSSVTKAHQLFPPTISLDDILNLTH